jgi:hypothetical protein
MEKISHKIRWWIALTADLLVLVPSGVQSRFWRGLYDGINAWTYLFLIACLGLFALGVAWYLENINRHFAALKTDLAREAETRAKAIESVSGQLTDAVYRLEDSIRALKPSSPTPQTDYDLTVSLRDELQRFIDELGEEPKPDYKLGHAEFNNKLELVGRFERRLRYGFQLRIAPRIQTLGYRLAEKSIDDGLLEIAAQQPKHLATLYTIRDRLSDLTSALKPKS